METHQAKYIDDTAIHISTWFAY